MSPRTAGRAALPAALLALGLALTGCAPSDAADAGGTEPDPVQPSGVVRTPEPVESAPLTVPLPGPTNSPNVSGDLTPSPAG